jgi:hypothetical protein
MRFVFVDVLVPDAAGRLEALADTAAAPPHILPGLHRVQQDFPDIAQPQYVLVLVSPQSF